MIKLDVHTHTIMSGHAFSTLQEMVNAAMEHELDIFGITEHGASIPGACDPLYFNNIHVVPREWRYTKRNGEEATMRLMLGAELNILDCKGNLDYVPYFHRLLDLRIAGVHKLCYEHGTQEEETAGMIAAIRNPLVQIISHPGDGAANLIFEEVVKAAKESGTILEINNASFKPTRGISVAYENNRELLRLAKQYEMPVILGSDAHITFDIANYEYLYPLLAETEFPDELILNYDTDKFLNALKDPLSR